jgi:hypothetical protein
VAVLKKRVEVLSLLNSGIFYNTVTLNNILNDILGLSSEVSEAYFVSKIFEPLKFG